MDTALADDVARRFAQAWAAPSHDAIAALLADDVVLRAPMMATTRGKDAGLRAMDALLGFWPGVRGTVHRWGACTAGVIVEWEFGGPLGRRDVRIPAVDRITISGDGLIAERVAYFDPTPMLLATLAQPRLWAAAARSGLGPSALLRRRRAQPVDQ